MLGDLHLRLSRLSLRYYLSNVVIASQPNPRRFGDICEDWQRELIEPKIALFEHLAGLCDYDGPMSFYDQLSRGSDKSSLEARLATWLLLASQRQIQGYIIAADLDQGALLLKALVDEMNLNPWVKSQLKVTKNSVSSSRGTVEVMPADAASAYGLRGNLFILDEVNNWPKRSVDMWTAIFTGREKSRPSVLGIMTNAGVTGTWQHDLYENIKTNSDFVVWDKPGHLASWVSKERLDNARGMVPPAEARRLYDNLWVDPGEDSDYLTREDVAGCVDAGAIYSLRAHYGTKNYVVIGDYGPKRDRSVITVMHVDAQGINRIDRQDVYTGRMEVSRYDSLLDDVISAFNPKLVVLDPYQMAGSIERLRKKRVNVEEVEFRGGRTNQSMAMALRAAVVHKLVRWYPGCGKVGTETLEDELTRLVTVRKAYGFRFDHEATGHDDRAFTIAVGLLHTPRFPHRAV